MSDKTVVCICGGGNGSHVLTCLTAAHAGTEARVLTLTKAADWTRELEGGDLTVNRKHPDGTRDQIRAKPAFITKDPSKAVPGADVIIFCVPAFAHQQYMEAIAPHVQENTSIIGLPGQLGFEFQVFDVLKEKAKTCTVLNYESLPWVCRITEFGRKVDVQGTKDELTGSRLTGRGRPRVDPTHVLQDVLGERPVLHPANSHLEMILMCNTISHPTLMYAKWKDFDGKPLDEKPLFYTGLDEFAASVLNAVSEEIVRTAEAVSRARPDLRMDHVEPFHQWLLRNYRQTVGDPSCLYTAMRSNTAYEGLRHPMREVSPGQWVPDFRHRYLSEDVPFGLAVTKGVAQILDVSTPVSDTVLAWAQRHLGTDVIRGDTLSGTDLDTTRAPQAFGFKSLEDLLSLAD